MSASHVHRSLGRAHRERMNGLRGIPSLSVREITRICTEHGVTGPMVSEMFGVPSDGYLRVLNKRALLGRPRSRRLLRLLRQLHYLDEGEEVVGEAIDTRTDAADTLSAGPDAADTVAAAHPSDSDTSSGTSDSDMELDERLGLMLRNLHVPFSDMGMKQRLRRSLKNIFQDIQDMGELDCHRLPADSRKLAKKVRDLGAHVASLVTNFEESLRPWGSSGYRRLYKVIGSSSDSDGESCGPEDVGTGGKRKLTPTFLLAKAQPGPHTAASPAPTPPLDQTQPTEEVASQSSAAPLGNLAAEEDSDKGFEKRGGSAVAPLTTAADLTATFKVGPRNEAGEGEGISTEARNSDSSSLESTSGRSCCGSGSGAVGLESAAGSSHSAGTSASNCVENTGSSCSGGGGGQGDGDHWGLEGCPVPGSRAGDAVCRQDGAVDAGNCVCLDPSSAEPAQDGFLNRLFEILRFDEEAFFMDVFPVVRSLGPRRSHGEEGPLGSWRSEAGTAAAGEGREEVTGGALTGNVAEKQQQEGTEKSAGGAGSSGWAKKGMMEYSVQRKLEERADAYVGAVTAAAFKNFNLHRVLGRHRSLGLRMWLRDLVKSMDGEVKAMQKDPKLAIAEGWLQLWEEHTARAHWFLEELRIGISLSDIHATMRRHLANSLLEAPGQPDREDCCRMAELSIKLQLDLRDVAAYQTERLAADDPQGAFEPPTSSCHDSNPFTATFEDPSSAELAEDDWIHVVDQDLAPLWLRLAQRSLDVTAALRGRKRVEILVHGSDVQTHFEIIAHMCLMYEKDLAMLVLLDDDVGFGNGGELQQRHPEPPPVVSAATASETRAHSRQPRTRSGKAGADAAAAAARERGAVANGVPAVARSDLQCELLARRFEYRWPVVVVGAKQLAALLHLQAMYSRIRHRSDHVAMWVPLALKPPARDHSSAQQPDLAEGAGEEADGRGTGADVGCRDPDPYQPGPGSPACLAVQFLGRSEPIPKARGTEVTGWSFNALYCEVHRKVRKQRYAVLQCDSVEDVQMVALVAAKVRDDMLTNHLTDVACITQAASSDGEIREWQKAINRRSNWFGLFSLIDDGRQNRLGRLTILVVALRSRQGTTDVKTELFRPTLLDMDVVVGRGGTVLRDRAKGTQQRLGAAVRRVKLS